MNRSLIVICVILLSITRSSAHLQGPFYDHALAADNVYFASVTAVDGTKISFAITEVIKGSPITTLTLITYDTYPKNSEWLLASGTPHGWGKDSLGWALKGDCAWVSQMVIRSNDKIYIKDRGLTGNDTISDILPDGSRVLTLDHLKQLLKDHVTKP